MSWFCRLASCHTGNTANVMRLAPVFPVGACPSTCAVLPRNLMLAHPDLPMHASWRTSTKPPGLSSFAAYPLLLPLRLAVTLLWELVPLVGFVVRFGLNCCYLALICISVPSLSLTKSGAAVAKQSLAVVFGLMMKSNVVLGNSHFTECLFMCACVFVVELSRFRC